MVAIRRLPLAALLAVSVGACVASPAPTPIPAPSRIAAPATPASTATPAATAALTPTSQPSTAPSPTTRPTSGFFFQPAEILAYYEDGVGFSCENWQAVATAAGHQARACRLADALNPPGDQVVTVTIDAGGDLADILASYVHRDGSTVDRDAAMRFFVTVVGASFGGDDGEVAASWLTGNLGAPSAALDLRGLRFGTFLADVPEDRASALFIEIATPAFTAAAS